MTWEGHFFSKGYSQVFQDWIVCILRTCVDILSSDQLEILIDYFVY